MGGAPMPPADDAASEGAAGGEKDICLLSRLIQYLRPLFGSNISRHSSPCEPLGGVCCCEPFGGVFCCGVCCGVCRYISWTNTVLYYHFPVRFFRF